MAKISFTLHNIAKDIRRAEKTLRTIKKRVVPADQTRIDLELRTLEKAYQLIAGHCPKSKHPPKPFGQWFESKPR